MKPWLLFLFSFTVHVAHGTTVTVDFSSRAQLNNGIAIWNQELGKIHPSLSITQYTTGATPIALEVGDGSDGPFDSTTYAQFSVGGDVSGNIIHLDTAQYTTLRVTHFILDAGWKLVPIGNNPLIIESLGNVTILGEIWCHGTDGTAGSGATPGTGGSGRCGGKNGGSGGTPLHSGASGDNAHTSVTGGEGGDYKVASVVGGGGGGSWSSTAPNDGPNASVDGGRAGNYASDRLFTIIAGGAGGGGGAGNATDAGGGGGAGGGSVIIRAVGDITVGEAPTSATGFIFANGGQGGDGSGNAGPGGGGGGGSIQLSSGGTFGVYNISGSGATQANAGSGGTNGAAAAGASGGLGRSFMAGNSSAGAGSYNPPEEFPINQGAVEYSTDLQTVTSNTIDLENNFSELVSKTISPSSPRLLLEFSGSSDGFLADSTGWTSNFSLVAHKRYLKWRLSITNTDSMSPIMADSISFVYIPGSPDKFAFKSAGGCGSIHSSLPPAPWNFLLLLLAPACLLWRRHSICKTGR